MVYKNYVLVTRPRPMLQTTRMMKEMAINIYNEKGLIRKFSNEGVMKPYRTFRTPDRKEHAYVRYLSLSCDLSVEGHDKFDKLMQDLPDVLMMMPLALERHAAYSQSTEFFPLDLFSRPEEEIHWPPQANTDMYEKLEMGWKEHSRTRWSDYLRN